MNRAEWIKTVLEAGRSVLGIIALGAVLILLFVSYRSCQAKSEALARLERAEEAHAIDTADLLRVHEADRSELEGQVAAAKAESADFASALAKVKKEFRTKTVFVATASTGPVLVEAPVPPGDLKPDPFHVERPSNGCLLWPGDSGEVKVTAALEETPEGNLILVGAADALRVAPEPALKLFGGEFRTEVSKAYGEPVALPPRKRWIIMAGPAAAITSEGGRFGGGVGVVSPPFVFDRVGVGAAATFGNGFGTVTGGVAFYF